MTNGLSSMGDVINQMPKISPSVAQENTSEPKYNCPACKDTGDILRRDEYGRLVCKPCLLCNIHKKRRIKLLLDKAELPYHTMDVPPQPPTLEYLKNFDANKPMWILFAGKAGSGKTTEAAWLAYQLICKKFARTRFFYAFDLTRRLQATIRKPQEHSEIIDTIADVDLVIVDDFFKGAPNPNSFHYAEYMEACYEIIWTRYDVRKPLIITSQLTIPDFMRIDSALSSRILEMCKNYTITYRTDAKNWRINA